MIVPVDCDLPLPTMPNHSGHVLEKTKVLFYFDTNIGPQIWVCSLKNKTEIEI